MNAHKASLINAILLIAFGSWAYLSSDTPSVTALIPVGFGVALVLVSPGVKKENKIIAHVAVLLTLFVLLGLGMAMKGVIGREDSMGMIRVGIMLASTVLAMVMFVKSFIDARKARQE